MLTRAFKIVLGVTALILAALLGPRAILRGYETAHLGMGNSLVNLALAQIGCVPNPNDNGAPFTNSCPITARGLNLLANAAGIGLPQVSNNTALGALSPVSFTFVQRLGFSAVGDSPSVLYTLSGSACSIGAGSGDGGSQVPASGGGNCWLGQINTMAADPRIWGGKGDGVTQASTPLQAAINFVGSVGGGNVTILATGHAWVVNAGLSLPAGVHLVGSGGLNWTSPIDNTEGDWTKAGSWFHCEDVGNPCITMAGNSTAVDGINFWYTQPTPIAAACGSPCTFVPYSWNTFPYTILVANTTAAGARITNDSIVNASHCVDWEGPSNGVAGVFAGMEHDNFGCFNVGTRFHLIDNTLDLHDLHYEMWWYQGNAQWWYAMEGAGTHVDWDVEYLANPIIDDVEFAFSGDAIKFTDATVSSGFGNITFAAANFHAHGISFNEVCTAMTVAASTTHVTGTLEGVTLAGDTTTSQVSGQCENSSTPSVANAFYLASDNANLTISNLIGGDVQSFGFIGGGGASVHGQLHLRGINMQAYSDFLANGVALTTDATGSIVDSTGNLFLYPSSSFTAGALCSGAGCFNQSQQVLGSSEVATPSGTNGQLCFTNLATPPATPGGAWLGTQVFCARKDLSGNFDLDRYVSGVYDESPIQIAGTAKAPVQFPETIAQSKGFSDVPILISGLPSCVSGLAGTHRTISNGVSSPTYGSTVSSTGSITEPVFCNGANWTYQ